MSIASSKKSDYEDDVFEDEELPPSDCYDEESINQSEIEDELFAKLSDEDLSKQSDKLGTEETIQEISSHDEEEPSILDISDDTSSVELRFTSNTPTSFNSDDHAFHLNFISKQKSTVKSGNGSKKSFSFTNERMREIERHNRILLQKILTKKPTYENPFTKKVNNFSCKNAPAPSASRTTSAALNRKKQQMQIDRENQILKRKIESIASRRSRTLS